MCAHLLTPSTVLKESNFVLFVVRWYGTRMSTVECGYEYQEKRSMSADQQHESLSEELAFSGNETSGGFSLPETASFAVHFPAQKVGGSSSEDSAQNVTQPRNSFGNKRET